MLMCLTCGRLSKQSRCPLHRKTTARGLGAAHRAERQARMLVAPWCAQCGHRVCGDPACIRCPLQLDHVVPRQYRVTDSRRRLLCIVCHKAKTKGGGA
jgi:5-methylcytosine-specific restriction endonuclease McrA